MLHRFIQCHPVFLHQKSYYNSGTSRHTGKTMHQHCATLFQGLLDKLYAGVEVGFQVSRGAIQNSHNLVGEITGELRGYT